MHVVKCINISRVLTRHAIPVISSLDVHTSSTPSSVVAAQIYVPTARPRTRSGYCPVCQANGWKPSNRVCTATVLPFGASLITSSTGPVSCLRKSPLSPLHAAHPKVDARGDRSTSHAPIESDGFVHGGPSGCLPITRLFQAHPPDVPVSVAMDVLHFVRMALHNGGTQ